MFSKIIKTFFLKKIVAKKLRNYKLNTSEGEIKTVGIIVDRDYFVDKQDIVKEFVKNGVAEKNITVLTFKETLKAKEVLKEPCFSFQNIGVFGEISKKQVRQFVETPFDMLVNFYDKPQNALYLTAITSKAKFKVGFSGLDERINHFTIVSDIKHSKEFVKELFKYLKIFKKI